MASSRKQTYEVVITANGNAAEHVLAKLKGDAIDVKQQMDQLVAAGKENTKGYKELEQTYQVLQDSITKAERGMKSLEQVMDNLSGATTSELKRSLGALKRALDHTTDENPKRKIWEYE